jgi:hypothetical protein
MTEVDGQHELKCQNSGKSFHKALDLAIRHRHHNPQPSIPAARITELGSGMAAGATWVAGGTSGGGLTVCGETVDGVVCGTGLNVGGGTFGGRVGVFNNWASAGERLG